jgi:hypothetical protein
MSCGGTRLFAWASSSSVPVMLTCAAKVTMPRGSATGVAIMLKTAPQHLAEANAGDDG